MDFEKLIASFQTMANEYETSLPLLRVSDYVSNDEKNVAYAETGARLLVSSFLYWILTRTHISSTREDELKNEIQLIQSENLSPTYVLKEKFHDQILEADIGESIHSFCRQYIKSSVGGFATDYQSLFVEGTDLISFLDVSETWENFRQISQLIDMRYARFTQNDEGWNRSYREPIASPAQTFNDVEDWVRHIKTFYDLEKTPSGKYQARLHEYWAVIDAAIDLPSQEVANELINTYLHFKNAAILSSSWRILRTFPELLVFQAILDSIKLLNTVPEHLLELVDIFDSNLSDQTLDEMINRLKLAPKDISDIYVAALERGAEHGSQYAIQVLRRLR